jgi:hypothetical protein
MGVSGERRYPIGETLTDGRLLPVCRDQPARVDLVAGREVKTATNDDLREIEQIAKMQWFGDVGGAAVRRNLSIGRGEMTRYEDESDSRVPGPQVRKSSLPSISGITMSLMTRCIGALQDPARVSASSPLAASIT